MSVTLLQLKTGSRQRADMENSKFIEDPELVDYINSSIAELHDLLVASYGSDYFLTSTTISTVANQADYSLPTTFYKLMGVDLKINNSEYLALSPFNFNSRNKRQGHSSSHVHTQYRLMGSNLKLSPVPNSPSTLQIWFVPKAVRLVADTDTLDDLNQFSEYVIVDAAIKMLMKEESDVSTLLAIKADLRRRIEVMAQNRDAGSSEQITDIHDTGDDLWVIRST